jgi:hypothetical protein
VRLDIPLWFRTKNDTRERMYLLIEAITYNVWGSGGINKDRTFKIYREGRSFEITFQTTHGKVDWSVLKDYD